MRWNGMVRRLEISGWGLVSFSHSRNICTKYQSGELESPGFDCRWYVYILGYFRIWPDNAASESGRLRTRNPRTLHRIWASMAFLVCENVSIHFFLILATQELKLAVTDDLIPQSDGFSRIFVQMLLYLFDDAYLETQGGNNGITSWSEQNSFLFLVGHLSLITWHFLSVLCHIDLVSWHFKIALWHISIISCQIYLAILYSIGKITAWSSFCRQVWLLVCNLYVFNRKAVAFVIIVEEVQSSSSIWIQGVSRTHEHLGPGIELDNGSYKDMERDQLTQNGWHEMSRK
jgi:hypothetical protein